MVIFIFLLQLSILFLYASEKTLPDNLNIDSFLVDIIEKEDIPSPPLKKEQSKEFNIDNIAQDFMKNSSDILKHQNFINYIKTKKPDKNSAKVIFRSLVDIDNKKGFFKIATEKSEINNLKKLQDHSHFSKDCKKITIQHNNVAVTTQVHIPFKSESVDGLNITVQPRAQGKSVRDTINDLSEKKESNFKEIEEVMFNTGLGVGVFHSHFLNPESAENNKTIETINHGDLHLNNIYYHKNTNNSIEIGFIDLETIANSFKNNSEYTYKKIDTDIIHLVSFAVAHMFKDEIYGLKNLTTEEIINYVIFPVLCGYIEAYEDKYRGSVFTEIKRIFGKSKLGIIKGLFQGLNYRYTNKIDLSKIKDYIRNSNVHNDKEYIKQKIEERNQFRKYDELMKTLHKDIIERIEKLFDDHDYIFNKYKIKDDYFE